MKQIVYKKNYISLDLVNEIRHYFDDINDSLMGSNGPYSSEKNKLGYQGCWDRQLHFEKSDNPIHQVIIKLKKDFGDFEYKSYKSSIRYLSAPFLPHSDIVSNESLKTLRTNGYKEGHIFIIPLWWKDNYQPVTGFFNSPARLDEPLYVDKLDIFPEYAGPYQEESKNLSVREIIQWQSPGDLIAWENFQWHASGQIGQFQYDRKVWVKEFISIETKIKI